MVKQIVPSENMLAQGPSRTRPLVHEVGPALPVRSHVHLEKVSLNEIEVLGGIIGHKALARRPLASMYRAVRTRPTLRHPKRLASPGVDRTTPGFQTLQLVSLYYGRVDDNLNCVAPKSESNPAPISEAPDFESNSARMIALKLTPKFETVRPA